jgi:glucans biosynthesis protein
VAFDYGELRRRAQALAGEAYEAPLVELPEALRELSYDQYRDIRFIPEQSIWRDQGLPFQLQFFHRGFLSLNRVAINIIDAGTATPLPFSSDYFDYGKNNFAEPFPADLGYAGFRIHYPINRPDYHDEVAVFLGASYFRAVGAGQHYGRTALAVRYVDEPGMLGGAEWLRLQRGHQDMTANANRSIEGRRTSG